MAFKTALIHIPWIEDDGEVTIRTLRVALSDENWRVLHLIGNGGRNTDVNSALRRAFREAQIDMPGNVVAQVDGLQTISTANRSNLMLALAIGIMSVMNRGSFKNIDKRLVAGSLDINGNIYPPVGISSDLLNQLAHDAGLKSLGCTASGADLKLDTIVGLVP